MRRERGWGDAFELRIVELRVRRPADEARAEQYNTSACSLSTPCLFHIPSDPEERQDLAASNPAKVAELLAEMEKVHAAHRRASYFKMLHWPAKNQSAYCAAAAAHSGFLVPWLRRGDPIANG